MDQANNFAKATVVSSFDDTETEFTVDTGQGLRFPTVPFNATLYNATDYPDPADDPAVEIVRVTDITGDVLTVTRNQEGTFANDASVGKTYFIIAGLTAKTINDNAPQLDRLLDTGTAFRINDGEGAVLLLDRDNGVCSIGDVDGVVEGTKITINDPATTVTITRQVIMPNLPTSNPAIAGALWSDSGTLKISAG